MSQSRGEDMRPVCHEIRETAPAFPDEGCNLFIFRTTYKDQRLWEKYMEYIRKQASLAAQQPGFDIPKLNFILKDDPTLLDGASKEKVRDIYSDNMQAFLQECYKKGDADGCTPPEIEPGCRPTGFCLYVDDRCLQSFAYLDWERVDEIREQSQSPISPEEFIPIGPDAFGILIKCQLGNQNGFSDYPGQDDAARTDEQNDEIVDMPWMPVQCRWLSEFYACILDDTDLEYWKQGWRFCLGGEGNSMWPLDMNELCF